MIHLMNFLLKIIATLILLLSVGFVQLIALIMWDGEIMETSEEVFELIWKKQKK